MPFKFENLVIEPYWHKGGTISLGGSHLLFADDSLLFFKADVQSAQEVRDVLNTYCAASGQQVNMDKSSVHFAKKCNQNIRTEIMEILEVHNVALSERYLGMPTDVGSSPNISRTGCGNEYKAGWS